MRTRGNAIIAGLALAALVVVGLVSVGARRGAPVPYDSASAAPDGTLALYRWIDALGYTPRRLTASPLAADGLGALFVLEPQTDFSSSEAQATLRWVRGGGMLVLLEDENGGEATLLAGLKLSVLPLTNGLDLRSLTSGDAPYGAAPVQPLLERPALRGLDTTVSAEVTATESGIIPVLGNGGLRSPGRRGPVSPADPATPVLMYERLGRGQVYAGSVPAVLTNGRIGAGDNRRLVPNVLAGLPPGAAVGLDDYHLVVHDAGQAQGPTTLNDVLFATAWGRALLYALAIVFLYIVLTGRRLGRPLRPVPERGRSLAEYVVSMAAIFRRAELRTRVLSLWQDDLRRTLAGPGGRRGRADDEVVAEAARRAALTPEEGAEALTLLRARPVLSERALVELCQRIARLQQRLVR